MEEKYYILQDNKTKEYLCIDTSSGGYPWFSADYKNAEKFKTENDINNFYNGGKWNGAYKEMFPKECKNLVTKLVVITTKILDI